MNQKPVCGSDGLTYPTRCHLERARCHVKTLTLQKRGPCRERRTCLQAVAYSHEHPEHGFKPQCRADGSYSAAQCHPDTGYCWCVQPDGTPLAHTSVAWSAGARPRCGRKKHLTRRRSRRQHKRRCKQHDKAVFNNNLIKIFYTEWSRDNNVDHVKMSNESDRTVLFWKFDHMDVNKNGVLDKFEYKDLQKIVKKAVRPKRCAKNFARACDMNNDQIITRQEWAECLTRDGMDGRC